MEVQLKCLDKLYDFNATRPSEMDKRMAIIKEMFGDIGEGCYIEPPFHANWGGKHCHFAKLASMIMSIIIKIRKYRKRWCVKCSIVE